MTLIRPATAGARNSLLLRSDAEGVATLTLNRPAQFNCLSASLLSELQDAVDEIGADRAIRVVIIAGAGKAYCAGHDLKELRAHRDRRFAQDVFGRFSRLMLALTRLPQPVIARVHGTAYAAGCQLIAQCDLAVASTAATFATSGINFGLFCNTPGVSLARNVPRKRAFEMLVTGNSIDAGTALEIGLVNRVASPERLDDEVAGLASSILEKSPITVSAGKRLFYQQIEADLEEAYRLATEAMVENMMTEDALEGIDAFTAKRRPVWKNK
jgi:enoyl-CoA hydratase/carnithine racemase